jgi:predicted metal-dependent peptidase
MKIEKIGAAILRMMQSTRQEEDRLFYGSILLKTIIEQSTKVPTMGVCVKNSELYLYYNPAFVEPLTMIELIAVLEHEVLHIIYEHMNVNKEVDRTIHNVACDIAINQMIQNLPKGCLFPEQFQLPKDKNSTWYYNELMKKAQKQPKGGQDKDGKGNDGGTIDDHSQWSTMSESDKEVIRQTIESTIKDQGTVPSKIEEQIKKLEEATKRYEAASARQILSGRSVATAQPPQQTEAEQKKSKAMEFWKGTDIEKALKKHG